MKRKITKNLVKLYSISNWPNCVWLDTELKPVELENLKEQNEVGVPSLSRFFDKLYSTGSWL